MFKRTSFLRFPLIALFTASALVSSFAHADEEATLAERKAEARTLADKGYELYEAGQFDASSDAFRKADELFHAPTLVYGQAKALLGAGKLLEARAVFQRVVDETLAPNAPAEFTGAQQSAKEEIQKLESRIAQLTLVIEGAAGRPLALRLDESELAASALASAIELNPGEHTILVTPEGASAEKRTLRLAEGAREHLTIVLPPPAPSSAPPPPPPPPSRGSLTPAFVAFGVGAAGLGVGAITGLITMSQVDDISSRCPDGICPITEHRNADQARTTATISTVSFVLGGVGIAAGTTLLILRPKIPPLRLGLRVGPGSLQLQGVF